MTVLNKTQLSATKNVSLANNNTNDITPAVLRSQQQDIIDSMLALENTSQQVCNSNVRFTGTFVADQLVFPKYINLVTSESVALTQEPAALNTPLQIIFGSAVALTDISISAGGLLTFLTSGNYLIEIDFNTGRTGAAGSSRLIIAEKFNGAYTEAVSFSSLTDADANHQINSIKIFNATANNTLSWDIIRDNTGDNSGGLYLFNPNLAGVPNLPTARLTVYRYQ